MRKPISFTGTIWPVTTSPKAIFMVILLHNGDGLSILMVHDGTMMNDDHMEFHICRFP